MHRKQGQTYVEFAREQELMFDKWYRSLKVDEDFDHLRQVVLLEEFKKSLPFGIKSHIDDLRITKLGKAALRADEYEVTHKGSENRPSFKNSWNKKGKRPFESYMKPSEGKDASKGKDVSEAHSSGGAGSNKKSATHSSKVCSHCNKQGHLKETCWQLVGRPSTKEKKDTGCVMPASVPVNSEQADESVSMTFAEKVMLVNEEFRPFLHKGEISHCISGATIKSVVILRDTGSAQSLMVPEALPPDSTESTKRLVQGIFPEIRSVPLYEVDLKCDLVNGLKFYLT